MIRIPALKQTIGFADGKKYFSLLQQMLPYMANLIPSRYRPLLLSTRHLAEVAVYAQMKMPTFSRLKKGREALLRFGQSIEVSDSQQHFEILTEFRRNWTHSFQRRTLTSQRCTNLCICSMTSGIRGQWITSGVCLGRTSIRD
jgi:hypothetical protein